MSWIAASSTACLDEFGHVLLSSPPPDSVKADRSFANPTRPIPPASAIKKHPKKHLTTILN
jgi:hypothetical protein